MTVSSPLRYPGGKSKLTSFVEHTIEINDIKNPIYCEPFCGGSGVAINLLLKNKTESIILNDFDVAIFSLWNAILKDSDKLIEKIKQTPVTVSERDKQKNIYLQERVKQGYSFKLGFATLF